MFVKLLQHYNCVFGGLIWKLSLNSIFVLVLCVSVLRIRPKHQQVNYKIYQYLTHVFQVGLWILLPIYRYIKVVMQSLLVLIALQNLPDLRLVLWETMR